MPITMVWRQTGRLCVVAHSADAPSPEEWEKYVRELAAASAQTADMRVMVRTRGGAPDGAQRKRLTDALDVQRVPSAILTDSALARTVGTAISWFVPHLKVFGFAALEPAFAYLQLSPSECARAKDLLAEVEHELFFPNARRRGER